MILFRQEVGAYLRSDHPADEVASMFEISVYTRQAIDKNEPDWHLFAGPHLERLSGTTGTGLRGDATPLHGGGLGSRMQRRRIHVGAFPSFTASQ